MAQALKVEPFTAARIARLSAAEAKRELTRIGIRHFKRNKLMRWDGNDLDRAFEAASLATQAVAA